MSKTEIRDEYFAQSFDGAEKDPDNLLVVKNLYKYFPIKSSFFRRTIGNVKAVDGVSFMIKRGTTMGLVGESGCGKSTTGRTIMRLNKPTAGKVFFQGRDIASMSKKELKDMRRDMQFIFQDPYASLNPRMTIGEIVSEPMTIHGIGTKEERLERVRELLDVVGLNPEHINRYPHEFSGGQRQRINVARALSLDPKIIVCDEPVSALDVSIQAQVLNLFRRLQRERGLTYIFISHDLSVVKHISDRVAIMYLGRVMEISPAHSIYENPLHPYTKALLSAIPPENPFERHPEMKLEGEIPSPVGKQVGCPLAGRCPNATERCHRERPALVEVEENHKVACFLYHDEVAE